jgi:hypothetical protein
MKYRMTIQFEFEGDVYLNHDSELTDNEQLEDIGLKIAQNEYDSTGMTPDIKVEAI